MEVIKLYFEDTVIDEPSRIFSFVYLHGKAEEDSPAQDLVRISDSSYFDIAGKGSGIYAAELEGKAALVYYIRQAITVYGRVVYVSDSETLQFVHAEYTSKLPKHD
ncbi:MAG TPA: hypothetical protein PLP33_29500 [Leptospiraceae bacterium]|nr:hypothetical protein [Leptospiraceae bacterium]